MSRIGKLPVDIPANVKVTCKGETLTIEGPLGKIENTFHEEMKIDVGEKSIEIHRPSDAKKHKALHGLTRALVNNMVHGVSQGFSKKLEIVGVGYTAKMDGKNLTLNIGFCHPVKIDVPSDLKCEVPSNTEIIISGADKQKVGQLAANIRRVRPPEPYKGKGIRYSGEHIIRKIGKAFGGKK